MESIFQDWHCLHMGFYGDSAFIAHRQVALLGIPDAPEKAERSLCRINRQSFRYGRFTREM